MKNEQLSSGERSRIPSFPSTVRLNHEHSDFIDAVSDSVITPLRKTIEPGYDPIKKEEIEVIKYTNPLTQEIHSNPKNGLKLPINDFGLLNLLVYNTQPGIRVSGLNNNLVLKMSDYITQEPFYTFNGQSAVPDTVRTLLDQSISEGITPKLKLIPYTTIEPYRAVLESEFKVEEDRNSFDYMYRIEDLAGLEGKQYKQFRNMCSKFKKETNGSVNMIYFKNQEIRPMIGHIKEVMGSWRDIKNKPKEEVDHLINVIERFSHYSKHFNMYNAGLYIDGQLSAFCFNEVVNNKYIVSHFGHANKNIPGIFQFFDHQLASRFYSDGFDYINLQQDLGKEGLRQYKMSYRPAFFLKKYTISPKQ